MSKERPKPPVRTAGPARRWWHLLLAAGAWAVFLSFWATVFAATPPREGLRNVLLVAVLFLVAVAATALWVRHNLLLARRYGKRRRLSRERPETYAVDALGRRVVVGDWDELRAASEVLIRVDRARGEKRYEAA